MKRIIFAAVLALSALTVTAPPAYARGHCLIEAVASCNADFPPGDRFNSATRGWCYMIRSGMCRLGW